MIFYFWVDSTIPSKLQSMISNQIWDKTESELLHFGLLGWWERSLREAMFIMANPIHHCRQRRVSSVFGCSRPAPPLQILCSQHCSGWLTFETSTLIISILIFYIKCLGLCFGCSVSFNWLLFCPMKQCHICRFKWLQHSQCNPQRATHATNTTSTRLPL